MATNAQAMCTSFKVDLLNGKHAFSGSYRTVDVFKAALFTANQSLGAATASYTTAAAVGGAEVSGSGYTAGGITVPAFVAPTSTSITAFTTPGSNLVYTGVTLATSFDCVLIYNSTDTGKAAVSVHTFSAQTITAGTLTLTMPANDASNALIRLA